MKRRTTKRLEPGEIENARATALVLAESCNDEDSSRDVVMNHLAERGISYDPLFLREVINQLDEIRGL